MKLFGLYIICILFFLSCSKEKTPENIPTERTVIVYMAADNDLSPDALTDIEEMKRGFLKTGNNLIVFIDAANELPCILEISPKSATKVRIYEEFNSAEAAQLKKVLNDIILLYPSKSYGLVLWSHGTSWLPTNLRLKSFGEDNSKKINIPDLAIALPVHFDFILFDACLMGAVEVAYELKDKTDYLIASSTETISEGFPYDLIVPELLKPDIDLKQLAKTYFDYYNGFFGAYRSATVSVTNTGELERLAGITRQLLSEKRFNSALFDRSTVQRLDVYEEQYVFDFLDFIGKAFPDADKNLLTEQLDRVVLYKSATEQFISEYNIEAYCGLSCYIPHPDRNDLNEYYKTLKWCTASGFNLLF